MGTSSAIGWSVTGYGRRRCCPKLLTWHTLGCRTSESFTWGPAFFAGLGVVFIRSMTAISATIFLISLSWTLITVRILENMTELSLGPAAAFSVFVIAVVMIVMALLNAVLRRLPTATGEQMQWGLGGG